MHFKLISLMFVALCWAVLLSSCNGSSQPKEDTSQTTPAKKPEEEKPAKPQGYQIGDVVEDFSLENIDGESVSLASLGDVEGVTVVFTCNTCPYAVMYEDRLVELSQKAQAAGYPLVAIMPNDISIKPGDSLDSMALRAKEKGFDFPYVIDAQQEVFPKFGATKTPEVFLLDKTDKGFQLAYQGAIDDNHEDAKAVETRYVENAYAALAAGEAISPSKTKAIGCSIKVKKGMRRK